MLTGIGVERVVGSWGTLGATRKIKMSSGFSLFRPSQRPLLAAAGRQPVCALSSTIIFRRGFNKSFFCDQKVERPFLRWDPGGAQDRIRWDPVCALSIAIIILSFDFLKLNFMNTVDILIWCASKVRCVWLCFSGFFGF